MVELRALRAAPRGSVSRLVMVASVQGNREGEPFTVGARVVVVAPVEMVAGDGGLWTIVVGETGTVWADDGQRWVSVGLDRDPDGIVMVPANAVRALPA